MSESWWSSSHEFESHHPYLFDKNKAQDNVELCKLQVQKAFTGWGVLENNINYILKPYITV